jgi:uncharacterized protein Usg
MPKISKQGPSWKNDPPRVPDQRDGEQVPSEVESDDEAIVTAYVNRDYDNADAWSYAELQAECKDRKLDGPLNVSREELAERLRAADEAEVQRASDEQTS